MRLTKQQKIYAAVLTLAVAAFGFDRFVLGPGGDATDDAATAAPSSGRAPARRTPARPASSAAQAAAAAAQAATSGGASASASASTSTLSARLDAVAAAHRITLDTVGDAFKPSPVWVGSPKQPAPAVEAFDGAAALQKRKLTAVIKQGAGGIAVIDKVYLNVGQSMDGFRLVAVKDRSAVLRRGNQRVELKLREDDGVGSTSDPANSSGTSEKIAGTDGGN